MKSLAALFATLLFSASPLALAAASENSEFFHQAGAGHFEVTPALDYATIKAKYKTNVLGLNSSTSSGTHFEVKGEYGINEMLAVGLILGHQNLKTEFSPGGIATNSTSKGLNDPDFYLFGVLPAGQGQFHFGTHFTYALAKDKTDSSGDSNAASGQWTLTPYVGYDMSRAGCIFGGRISYDLIQSDKKSVDSSTTPETTSTTSGGQTLTMSGFYEHQFTDMMRLGASLDVIARRSTDTETNSGSTSTGAPLTTGQLNVYTPLSLAPNFTLIPQISYTRFVAYDSATLDSASGILLHVGGRATF